MCWDPELNIYSMEKAGEIYAKDHPGFTVNVTEIAGSADLEMRLTTIASSGDYDLLPDIFLMQDNSLQKYIAYYPDLFTDLTDSGINFSDFVPSKLAYSVVDGRNYAVPFDSGAAIACGAPTSSRRRALLRMTSTT